MTKGTASPNPEMATGCAGNAMGCGATRPRLPRCATALLIGSIAVTIPVEAMADPVASCRQSDDLTLKVDSCTGLLAPLDGVTGGNGWALAERADAYCRLGQPEQAVVDIWSWLDQDPASARRMQARLAMLGFYAGEDDGGFSAAFDDAVIAWIESGCP